MRNPFSSRSGVACLLAGGILLVLDANAVEYPLQYTPTGNFKDLVVVGLGLVGNTVVGNCSYTRITSGSGRDPQTYYTPVPQTCTWNLEGGLISVASGAPMPQDPISANGTETIFAIQSPQLYAGTDSALPEGGFVFNYGSHYQWLTPNTYMVLPQGKYTFTATITSNGDKPLTVTSVKAGATLKHVKVTVNATNCIGQIPLDGTCYVTVTYNDSSLSSTTGLAYDTLTLHLTSDAAQTNDFVQGYTDEVRLPPNN